MSKRLLFTVLIIILIVVFSWPQIRSLVAVHTATQQCGSCKIVPIMQDLPTSTSFAEPVTKLTLQAVNISLPGEFTISENSTIDMLEAIDENQRIVITTSNTPENQAGTQYINKLLSIFKTTPTDKRFWSSTQQKNELASTLILKDALLGSRTDTISGVIVYKTDEFHLFQIGSNFVELILNNDNQIYTLIFEGFDTATINNILTNIEITNPSEDENIFIKNNTLVQPVTLAQVIPTLNQLPSFIHPDSLTFSWCDNFYYQAPMEDYKGVVWRYGDYSLYQFSVFAGCNSRLMYIVNHSQNDIIYSILQPWSANYFFPYDIEEGLLLEFSNEKINMHNVDEATKHELYAVENPETLVFCKSVRHICYDYMFTIPEHTKDIVIVVHEWLDPDLGFGMGINLPAIVPKRVIRVDVPDKYKANYYQRDESFDNEEVFGRGILY